MPLRLPRECANVDSSRHLTTFRAHWWVLDGFRPGFRPVGSVLAPVVRCPSALPQSGCPAPDPKRIHSVRLGRRRPSRIPARAAAARAAVSARRMWGPRSSRAQGSRRLTSSSVRPPSGPTRTSSSPPGGGPRVSAGDPPRSATTRAGCPAEPVEGNHRFDRREGRPAALAGGFPGDPAPALGDRRGPFGPGAGHRALRKDRHDAVDAEFGELLDDEVGLVALGQGEGHRQARDSRAGSRSRPPWPRAARSRPAATVATR